jgi:hypothetical protein
MFTVARRRPVVFLDARVGAAGSRVGEFTLGKRATEYAPVAASPGASSYTDADPFPTEKFLDPWWGTNPAATNVWAQINDFRDDPGNETAVANDAKARVAYVDAWLRRADPTGTALPTDPIEMATQAAAYAAEMNDKYNEHAGETLKKSAQYKGLKWAGEKLSVYLAGPAAGAATSWWLDKATDVGAAILRGINALGIRVGPAKDLEIAKAQLERMVFCLGDSITKGLPPSWQTPTLPVIVGGPNASAPYMADVVCWTLAKFMRMPRADREVVQQWWALYLAQANDPEIANAVSQLWNTGAYADDTQVVLVAMVIAKMAGLPWRPFAEKLWSRSMGWRGRPDLLLDYDVAAGLIPMRAGAYPVNAGMVQWQVLASDAFRIAEDERVMRIDKRVAKPSSSRSTSGGGVVMLGVAAVVALVIL